MGNANVVEDKQKVFGGDSFRFCYLTTLNGRIIHEKYLQHHSNSEKEIYQNQIIDHLSKKKKVKKKHLKLILNSKDRRFML